MTDNHRDEVREWERDWRTGVTSQLSDTVKTLSDVVGVLREMKDDVRELKTWKQAQENRATAQIDKAPENRRGNLALVLSAVNIGIYLLTTLVGVIVLIATHWK